MQQVLFQVFASVLSGSLHYFLWRQLAVRTQLGPRARRAVAAGLVYSWLAVPLTVWAARLGFANTAYTLAWIALPTMVITGLAFAALVVLHTPRWMVSVARRLRSRIARNRASDAQGSLQSSTAHVLTPTPATTPSEKASSDDLLSRRTFFARATASTATLVATTAVAKGIANVHTPHVITQTDVTLPGLAPALDGLRIIQLTDLHISMTIDAAFVANLVARTNALAPDIVVLTGDMVDGDVASLAADAAPLAALRARYGVFAVTGNHEYYSGADAWIAEFTKLGVTYLRNQRVDIGPPHAKLSLAGIDDWGAHRWAGHGADLNTALTGWQPNTPLVLLAHQPRQVHEAAERNVPLVLSGHTHGGQVWPWHYLAKLQQGGLLAGRYQVGSTTLYVSRGCGYWGPPVRVAAPMEIAVITLRAPRHASGT